MVIVATSPEQIPRSPVYGKLTTVYWDICGLGQPVRYALEIAGCEYVDVRVHYGPGEPGSAEYKGMWKEVKPSVGEVVPFVNLPYLMDPEGPPLAQSNTILKYIGRKFGFEGDDPTVVDLLLDQGQDLDAVVTGKCYRDWAGMSDYLSSEDLGAALSQFERFLGGKPFLSGFSLSVADLKVYETLRKLRIIEDELSSSVIAKFPGLVGFIGRVEAIPAMRSYMTSRNFIPRPLNNAHAQFK